MPFSFLNPWFWLGALAVAAPIWLHLRRKRETNLVEFTALRFLDDQPEPRRSPLRLRDLVLFALRVLALLLLVAAFAWPYLRGANTAPVKESRVYILDNTLSHQANDGFARDRDRVLSEVSKGPSDIQMAVIELTSAPRVVVSFGENRETAKQKLKELEPSYQRGSYLPAFRQANSLLGNSLGEQKRIILLGDNQENQWTENVNSPPFLRNVQIELPKINALALPNLSLSEPRVQRIFLGDKSLVNFTVKLRHAGEAKTANIVLRANEQVIFNRAVELEKQPETMLLASAMGGRPGSLAARRCDRGRDAGRAGGGQPGVLFARAGDRGQGGAAGAIAVFAAGAVAGSHARPMGDAGAGADETGGGTGGERGCRRAGGGEQLPAIRRRAQAALALRDERARGGAAGEPGDAQHQRLPAGVGLRGRGHGRAPKKGSAERFQFVYSNHPIFHPFLSPDYGSLMDVKVSKYVQLKGGQAMPLIFSEKGAGLFFQGTKFPGKLFVAAFGLDREHTSWPVDQTFIPFLDLTLQTARAEDPTPTTFEPGEISKIQLPVGSTVKEAVLAGRAPGAEPRAGRAGEGTGADAGKARRLCADLR